MGLGSSGLGSFGASIVSAFKSLFGLSIEGLADVVAIWDTARQVVRQIASGAAQAAGQQVMNDAWSAHPHVPLSPAVLADMSIRSIGDQQFWYTEALKSGIDQTRFDYMSLDTGESYGVIDALSLWHRGQFLPQTPVISMTAELPAPVELAADQAATYGITEKEFLNVIHYARMRDEFQPDVEKLAYRSMSPADAVNLLVKGRTDYDTALAYFVAGGGMPEQFDPLFAASGDAVGVVGAVMLHHRGYIDDAELDDVLHQSRINPRFYPIARLQYLHFLAPYQIRQAVAAGAVTPKLAQQWLLDSGYPPDQAAAFTAEATSSTLHKPKAETEAMLIDEWHAGMLSEAEVTKALTNLGYVPAAVPFILQAYEAARVLAMRNAAITRLREAFVERLMTADDVATELASLGLLPAAISRDLDAWKVEQATNIKRLSMAQIGKLAEEGYITSLDAMTMWGDLGYPPQQASLLLLIYPAGSKAPPNAAISADPTSITADGHSTSVITVQANSMGTTATKSMGTVVLHTTLGRIGSVDDHNNGTYSAVLIAGTTPGLAQITGTIGGQPIGVGTDVSFNAAPIAAPTA